MNHLSSGSLFLCCIAALTGSALAQFEPIAVTVWPDSPTVGDEVVIRHDLIFMTGGYSIGGSDVTFVTPFNFLIDVYVSAPNPGEVVTDAITYLAVESNLGPLPPGQYHCTSRVAKIPRLQLPDPPSEEIFLQFPPKTRGGQFTVVPEPASLTLLALSGLVLTRRQRSTRC